MKTHSNISRRSRRVRSSARPLSTRHGLTLLETILALAILGVSMAVVGELVRIGARHAATARDLTTAQIHCESILNEIAAGAIAPSSVEGQPCEFDNEWVYSVATSTVSQPGVIAVEVTVSRAGDTSAKPVNCKLVRWIVDPETTAAAEESASSSS